MKKLDIKGLKAAAGGTRAVVPRPLPARARLLVHLPTALETPAAP